MYSRILVPVDGSPTSNKGLQEAIKLATLTGGKLRLLHVVDELSAAMGMGGFAPVTVDVFRLLKEGAEQVLKDASATVQQAHVPVDSVLIEGFAGRLAELVAQQVTRWGAELVVLGSHGRRGVGRMLMGSDAEQIIRTCPVPVLVVRAADTGEAKAPA